MHRTMNLYLLTKKDAKDSLLIVICTKFVAEFVFFRLPLVKGELFNNITKEYVYNQKSDTGRHWRNP